MTKKIFFLFRTLEPTLLIALSTLALDLGQKAELVRLLSYTLSSGTAKRGLGIAGSGLTLSLLANHWLTKDKVEENDLLASLLFHLANNNTIES